MARHAILQFAMSFLVMNSMLAFSAAWALADAPPPPVAVEAPPTAPPATVEQIAGWIEDLTSDDFETRLQAASHLQEAGKPAVGPVAEAVLSGDLDVSTRCMGILESLVASTDAETNKAAREALEKLARSEQKAIAARAESILHPPPARQNVFPGGGVRIQINAAQAQGARRMHVRIVNGNRTIDIKENGKKIHIADENGKSITVRVEEPDATGKLQKKEVKAADLDDLRKKDPEAAKLYEQHTRSNIQVRIMGNVAPAQPPAQPPAPKPKQK